MEIVNKIIGTDLSKQRIDMSLLAYRVIISVSLINTHGLKKVFHYEETLKHIPDPVGIGPELSTWFAIFSGVICPILIIPGFITRLWALPILATTLMGFFVVHANDPWPVRDVPAMYSIAFLLLVVLGPGAYSLDRWIASKLSAKK